MAEPPELDIERILSVFAANGVDFLLIGGVATRLYGAQRLTYDLDVVASRDVDNLDRAAHALRELGAFLRVGGIDDETARTLPVIVDGRALAAMEISTWRTDAGDIDLLAFLRNDAGDRVGFDELARRSSETRVGSVAVRVAGLEDIISSKRFADRDKDRDALPELEALRDADEGP